MQRKRYECTTTKNWNSSTNGPTHKEKKCKYSTELTIFWNARPTWFSSENSTPHHPGSFRGAMIENTDTKLIPSPPKSDARKTLYHCTEHLLYALLSEADDAEKQALYRSLEHLGIAQIRWLNASAAVLDGPSADVLPTTEKNHIN
ncbi:MAG: hypothetical protein M3N42_05630 [Cyanobacteriota bacterium]|nr:hypothetical protein [Cyanobacteriota bacterium]